MAVITFMPMNCSVEVKHGTTILEAEHLAGIAQKAHCGGHGKCGKCKVRIDGKEVLACRTEVTHDMEVIIPENAESSEKVQILTDSIQTSVKMCPVQPGELLAAIDIGTTTVVCYLLDGRTGKCLGKSSMMNPQYPFGADVVSRLQYSLQGERGKLTVLIQTGIAKLLSEACEKIGKTCKHLGTISIVGNPAMQQLFLGIEVENLAEPPFPPKNIHTQIKKANEYLAIESDAALIVLPDIAGYVGADTFACILSTKIYEKEEYTLIVDIGTNGEMVLGNKNGMLTCSTAAGPALEGAGISCGMCGAKGAVDHVWAENEALKYSVIENAKPMGICGSGLIDAVAVFLEKGTLNKRGKLVKNYEEVNGKKQVKIGENVTLTQEDIRAVQMAKGAIAAGIELLIERAGISVKDVKQVLLAGAFGSYIKPESACRIGMLPEELLPVITAVGNAAGAGSQMAACSKEEFFRTDELLKKIEPLELAALPEFSKVFAKSMYFRE